VLEAERGVDWVLVTSLLGDEVVCAIREAFGDGVRGVISWV